ncbi:MAG: carbonic anhydrase [Chloroflexota bacterium]|jgi:carbonic anhydrase|nr:carbonic anhydrase [Chloroflexota bacterium]
MFEDLLESNRQYQATYRDTGAAGRARRGLAVLTCIDSRVDPLRALGLRVGDAKIIRNAGARVTDDALRSLILATNLLGVTRVCIVHHTNCAVMGTSNAEVARRIEAARGVDASGWDFMASTDQVATIRRDVAELKACSLLPDLEVGGFILELHSGELVPVDVS